MVDNDVRGVLPFDESKYEAHCEDFDMTEEQQTEFLRTLWNIISAFVNLGFGADAILPVPTDDASKETVNYGDPRK